MVHADNEALSLISEMGAEHEVIESRVALLSVLCNAPKERTSCSGCAASQPQRCAEGIIESIGALLAYMVEHFRNEERGMQAFGYAAEKKAEYAAHISDHSAISDFFNRIVSQFDDRNPRPQVDEMRQLLRKWLSAHILDHDRLVVSYLQQLG